LSVRLLLLLLLLLGNVAELVASDTACAHVCFFSPISNQVGLAATVACILLCSSGSAFRAAINSASFTALSNATDA
jgi:hypothetical protein